MFATPAELEKIRKYLESELKKVESFQSFLAEKYGRR